MSLALLCCSKFHDFTIRPVIIFTSTPSRPKPLFVYISPRVTGVRKIIQTKCLPKAIKSEDINPVTKPESIDFKSIALVHICVNLIKRDGVIRCEIKNFLFACEKKLTKKMEIRNVIIFAERNKNVIKENTFIAN
jgi:hypothetical protein